MIGANSSILNQLPRHTSALINRLACRNSVYLLLTISWCKLTFLLARLYWDRLAFLWFYFDFQQNLLMLQSNNLENQDGFSTGNSRLCWLYSGLQIYFSNCKFHVVLKLMKELCVSILILLLELVLKPEQSSISTPLQQPSLNQFKLATRHFNSLFAILSQTFWSEIFGLFHPKQLHVNLGS